jgi:hypothetical protein
VIEWVSYSDSDSVAVMIRLPSVLLIGTRCWCREAELAHAFANSALRDWVFFLDRSLRVMLVLLDGGVP